ncbi:MAG: TRAP transporter large permease subunit [Desulfobacteraceae bacterium]|nr:MAG: TRAP transporter large permease subunit [Desulfobacteraceae bacterium]
MEWWMSGIIVTAAFMFLALLGVPIAFTLGAIGTAYICIFWPAALPQIAFTSFGKAFSYELVSLPLFVFMAEILVASKASDDAFDAIYKWVGPLPGGLAVSANILSGIFGATCGVASAGLVTIGRISMPEMLKRKYNKHLIVGSVCAGATVVELIPPSIFMILFGVISESSIGRLFMGGFIPGAIQIGLFSAYIIWRSMTIPGYGPPAEGITWKDKWQSLYKVLPLTILAVVLFGGLYTGIATATEIAAVGVVAAFVITFLYQRFTLQVLKDSIFKSVRTTVFIMWVLFAAAIASQMFTKLGIAQGLCEWMLSLPFGKYGVVVIINIVLFILGTFIDPAGIIVITVPIFAPIIERLGFDLVWFGVMFVINMEAALLTPPLGLNLFVIQSILTEELSDIGFGDVCRSIVPYLLLVMGMIISIIIFPGLVTWLPDKMIK